MKAGVVPISEYQKAINSLEGMLNANINDVSNGLVQQYVYPNGRAVSWDKNSIEYELSLIKRALYNKVFYDPASHVEHDWRVSNRGE